MKDNGDGTFTVSCPDGSTIKLTNGTNGTAGTNGTNGTNGANGDAGRDGIDGVDGDAGTSCSVLANPDAGTKVISCTDGTSVTITDGKDANALVDFATSTDVELAALDMAVTVTSITNVARPVVSFKVTDLKGRGVTRIPPANFSGLSLLQLVPGNPTAGGNGLGNDTWVSHITNCATCTSSSETATAASLVDNGDGTYRYTFLKDIQNPTAYDGGSAIAGVAFSANAVHRFGLRLAASGNPFRPVDAVFDYVPATGADVTGQNDKVSTSNCLVCHMQWRGSAQNAGGVTPFHSGQRYDARYCVVCHNDQRKYSGNLISGNAVIAEPSIDAGFMTPPAGQTAVRVLRGQAVIHLPVFVHKIHTGHKLALTGPYAGLGAEITEIAYPQDIRNCAKCHANAAQADNWKNKPSRRACGACHDAVDFATGVGHTAGPQADDNSCKTCHPATGGAAGIVDKHIPVAPLDPNNGFSTPVGGSSNTHASALGVATNAPAGAVALTYAMPATGAVTAVPVGDGGFQAEVKFKLMAGDAGVVFNSGWDGGSELISGFIGSPSVYCAYAVPQDGLATPADFNATVSGYLRNIWRGTATGTGAGTLTGPDMSGYYTVRLTGVTLPPFATMLTCGLGYSYNITSALPLTQANLTTYPVTVTADGGSVGGLSIPAPNIWRVATGYTGRRGATSSAVPTGQIVSPAKCNNCHNLMGIAPSFHAGQRNDGPTCSWCHTQNRTSAGWSAGSGSYIHAIHGAGKRTVPFNWRAINADEGFFNIKFPGRPQMCEGCHNPGYYDFSSSWYSETNRGNRLAQTVGQGTYNGLPTLPDGGVNTAAWSISPYVVADAGVNYGAGFAYSTTTQVSTNAAPTTLVNSPISNNCFGCHDSVVATAHMEIFGGSIYDPRSVAQTKVEQCLICHGPGKIAAIKAMHYQ